MTTLQVAASLGNLTLDAEVTVTVRQAWTIAVTIEGTAEEAVASVQQACQQVATDCFVCDLSDPSCTASTGSLGGGGRRARALEEVSAVRRGLASSLQLAVVRAVPEGQSVVAAVPMASAAVTVVSVTLSEVDVQLQVSESGGMEEAATLATSLSGGAVAGAMSSNLGIALAPNAVAVSNALFPPLPPPAAPPEPPSPPPSPPPPSPPPPTPPPPAPPPMLPPLSPPLLPPTPPLPPTPSLPPATPPPYPPPPTSSSIIGASLFGVLGVSGATILLGILVYLLWSRKQRRKQRDQTKSSYAVPAPPRVHSPAPRSGLRLDGTRAEPRPTLRHLDGTRAEPRSSPSAVKMSHSPFRASTVKVSPDPTPTPTPYNPNLGAAANAARFVTRVDPSGRERTGGVERFTTASPNQRRRSFDAEGRPTAGGGGQMCATRVRTVVSPPSSSELLYRNRVGALPDSLRSEPSCAGDAAGDASSSSEVRSRRPSRQLASCGADNGDFMSSSGTAVARPTSREAAASSAASSSGVQDRMPARGILTKPPPPPGLDDYLETLPA